MRYLVIYYNGKGNREKICDSLDEATEFKNKCGDLTATIWKEVIDE